MPEPDGPSIEKNSPSRTSRSMWSTATSGNVPRRPGSIGRRADRPRRRRTSSSGPPAGRGHGVALAWASRRMRRKRRSVTGAPSGSSVWVRRTITGVTGFGIVARRDGTMPHCAVRVARCQGERRARRARGQRARSVDCRAVLDLAAPLGPPPSRPSPRHRSSRCRRGCDAGPPPADAADRARDPPAAPREVNIVAEGLGRSCPIRSTSCPARRSCSTSSTAGSRSTRR